MKQRIIINKDSGEITTVYTDYAEKNILKNLNDFWVKRVSNIEFNNETKLWEAKDIINNKIITSSRSKMETYNKESEWANNNLKELKKIHFEENSVD